ncbi:MAG: spore cortex biosynthesis protein YabQ [Planifilum sp.]
MSLQAQWITMVTMVGSGLILGVALDTYRVLKERLRLRGWVVSLVDLLYWVAAASLVFHLLVWSNWGELRFYVFIAVLAGFWTYFTWFSDGVFRILRWLFAWLERAVQTVIRLVTVLVWLPLAYLWVLFRKVGALLWRLVRGVLQILLMPLSPLVRFFSPLGKVPAAVFRRILRWFRRLSHRK